MKSPLPYPRLLTLFFCAVAAFAVVGCTKARPDPRKNPDFNEEAYNDPNAAMKQMQGSGVKK